MVIRLETLPVPGGVYARVLRLEGSFVTKEECEPFEAFIPGITEGVVHVIADCEKITFMSSSFVGKLVSLYVHCKNRNTPLVFSHMPERYKHMFHILGLDKVFTIVEYEAATLTWQPR